ncbi:after-VIT domain-containing protein [Leptolyngbya cf. ectocarpi LEGE 11479]|uniref:After-VIT domain-containing protein n=1 Tax=Leptolyngbya cf. ectocarpi LEGE 11479 TaxID=1828722 RepID=A0A929F8V0_LEPEC|nr:VIT domain-containing protein [Leptolyngbya ectocarpi]MBE9069006.1 after-VIT domain-containing protein [Leptolyngbya cf. ectocarpi LEGE 11479]
MVQTLSPQTAGLYGQGIEEQPLVFPLKHTEVKAQVSGNISRVDVTHTFENPFTTTLDATYVFPLPDEAAVDTLVVRFCDRTIHGRIEKREEAQAIYQRAQQKGQTAGLLEQERANIFTQSLANIPPGEQIKVTIGYSDQLAYKQGSYEFVFPMVVGPRYIPGNAIADLGQGAGHGTATAPMSLNQDTDLVPDASRLNGPILPAGLRSGHDIQITVEIETGFELSNLQSPSHQIVVDTIAADTIAGDKQNSLTRITLSPSDTLPNKDLILRYQVASDSAQTSLLTQSDKRGGHFAVYLIPALSYDTTAYIPKDMVFLIDTSGSQSGAPLAQCQALMRRFIEGLHPQDTFNIVNFANTTQQLAKVSLNNTPRNRKQALNYVERLRAGGGTEMMRGFKTVLNLPHLAPEHIRNIVLLTDGYIGNETQIFAEVQRSLSPSSRLHSFGAGSSVNRFLLNRVAELGRGISQVVRHDEPIDQVVDTFFNQINNPVLGNLSLHWDGPGAAPSLYPTAVPDLFAQQPLILLGHKTDSQPGTLRITGMTGSGKPFAQSFAVSFTPSGNPAIGQLWGRARIKALMNQMVSGETTLGVEAITETALAYQLLSQYTAFVAVSDESRVEQPTTSVNVPVNMPEAISYEGAFGTAAPPMRRRMATMSAVPQPMAAPRPMPAQQIDGTTKKMSAPGGKVDRVFSMSIETTSYSEILPAEPIDLLADEAEFDFDATITAESVQTPTPSQQIQLCKAEELRDDVFEQLKQHLQTLQLLAPQTGKLVLKLVIQQGRVKRVMLDTENSDPQKPDVVDQIRRTLLSWHCPQTVAAPLRIELRIEA